MRIRGWIIAVVLLLAVSNVAYATDVNIQTGLNFNYWDSNEGYRGSQTAIPVTIFTQQNNFNAKVLTAFSHTNADFSDGSSNSLSCLIDSKANFSYEVVDKFFADLIFGLDFNLPTGKNNLKPKQQSLLLDPDLISINHFGEGFNVNPTVSLGKVWDKFAAGIGLGYLWRGEYDFSDTARNYDPGDIFSLTGEIAYSFSPKWQGHLFGEFAHYGKDELHNIDYYKEGIYYLLGMGLNYFQTNWDAALTLKGIFRGKSSFQEEDRGLKTEGLNSYGDEWIADISCKYYLSQVTTIRSRIFYLLVLENDYSSDSPFYIGDTRKTSLEFAVSQQFTRMLRGEFSLSGYILSQERNWYHSEDIGYRGFIAALVLTQQF